MIRRVGGYLAYREEAPNEASAHLQAQGYVTVPAVFTSDEVAELQSEIEAIYEQMPPDGRGPYTEAWPDFRYQMLNRSAACQRAIAHRGILDVIEPLLGEDCHVIANTAWRNPVTNGEPHGGVGWHIDAGPHRPKHWQTHRGPTVLHHATRDLPRYLPKSQPPVAHCEASISTG